jgi:hypothetical protein
MKTTAAHSLASAFDAQLDALRAAMLIAITTAFQAAKKGTEEDAKDVRFASFCTWDTDTDADQLIDVHGINEDDGEFFLIAFDASDSGDSLPGLTLENLSLTGLSTVLRRLEAERAGKGHRDRTIRPKPQRAPVT